ncbi:hypothetical protein AB0F91_23315 [Amycolatopsis sp. NPDC023774]|uniref:hypothetical protein n=1 Tax=Amycolatopsis sp. NPDC023774 TaxID=3155015 RepID=UPI0033CA1F79
MSFQPEDREDEFGLGPRQAGLSGSEVFRGSALAAPKLYWSLAGLAGLFVVFALAVAVRRGNLGAVWPVLPFVVTLGALWRARDLRGLAWCGGLAAGGLGTGLIVLVLVARS